MGNNNIILVGFMATGKTTLGKLLANTLEFNFIDTDRSIEKKEGATISDIFNLKGEAYFREKESEILDSFISLKNTIISTGGGMIISVDNRKKLRNIGKVIYLESKPNWILTNLKRSKTTRPLLNEKDPINKIIELLNKRKKYYEDVADVIVSVDEKSPNEIINNIISEI